MDTPCKSSRIDFGRWVAIPVFNLLLVWNLMASSLLVRSLFPVDAMKVLWFMNHLLSVAFLVLVILLYIRRGSATATTRSLPVRIVAMAAFALPFAMPFLGNAAHAGAATLAISSLIITAGLAFTLAALLTLGKSFSIIPQTRKLVVQGPYRLVRHPIYLGEIVTYSGMALAGMSIPKVLVVLLLILCQTYRAIQEEKLLAETFPDYLDYASKTPAFVPGFRPNDPKVVEVGGSLQEESCHERPGSICPDSPSRSTAHALIAIHYESETPNAKVKGTLPVALNEIKKPTGCKDGHRKVLQPQQVFIA